jgi:hypothetical protein
VTEVEVDEVLRLMCNEGPKISSYDTMPGWALSLIELCDC